MNWCKEVNLKHIAEVQMGGDGHLGAGLVQKRYESEREELWMKNQIDFVSEVRE